MLLDSVLAFIQAGVQPEHKMDLIALINIIT